MSPENKKLSQSDIDALESEPNTKAKINVIDKLSDQYNSNTFSKLQIEKAENIFRHLIKDTEIEVRKALSESIVSNSMVPKDVVLSLAKDVEVVACPVLEFSEVFSDEDLIELIAESESTAHQVAVTKRATISEGVSKALVNTDNEEVVESLLDNSNADISEQSYEKVVETFSGNELIVDSMVTRSNITERIVAKMADSISETMRKRLEARYKSSFENINTLFKDSGGIAALKLIGQQTIDEELMDLIDTLEQDDILEEALVDKESELNKLINKQRKNGDLPAIASLTLGHLTFFKIILSDIASLPYSNISKLIDDDRGFEALYRQAKMPTQMYSVVQLAVEIILDIKKYDDLEKGELLRNHSNIYIKQLTSRSRDRKIKNLAHFISIVKHNADKRKGSW